MTFPDWEEEKKVQPPSGGVVFFLGFLAVA